MAYFNESPHTRNYDDDLRELIEYYKQVRDAYANILAHITETVDSLIINGIIQISFNAVYDADNETINLDGTIEGRLQWTL